MLPRNIPLSGNRCGSIPAFSGRSSLDTYLNKKKVVKKVNQYYLMETIGEGSFAKVYLGYDLDHNEYYALKRVHLEILSKSISGISQLESEIEIMRSLDHPNIIKLKEVVHVPKKKWVYMVLQYADCGSLDDLLSTGVSLSSDQIRYIFKQVVEGLYYLHQNQVVHQDLKPANIMLSHEGTVLISDFSVGHSFNNATVYVGTPAFQAPEVIDFNNDGEYIPGKEDIWSLGVTLYLMVFGELPFPGETTYEIMNSIKETVLDEPLFDLGDNDDLWTLIKGMLKIDQKERLDISQVREFKYVSDAPDFVDLELRPHVLPVFNPSIKTQEMRGRVCKEGYNFNAHTKQDYHSLLKSQSLTFRSPFG